MKRDIISIADLSTARDRGPARRGGPPEGRAEGRHHARRRWPARRWRCCSSSRRFGPASRSRWRWSSSAAPRASSARTRSAWDARVGARRRPDHRAVRRRRRRAGLRARGREGACRSTARCPVISGLSDDEHPCQILADLLTLQERFGRLRGLTVAYVGDSNNVANSLLLALPRLGVNLVRRLAGRVRAGARRSWSRRTRTPRDGGALVEVCRDPAVAVANADAVYADSWYSMGQEHEATKRRPIFKPYQVNEELMSHARPEHGGDALPAGPSRRRDHRRGAGRSVVGRVPAGGESAARPEGAAAGSAGECRAWTAWATSSLV